MADQQDRLILIDRAALGGDLSAHHEPEVRVNQPRWPFRMAGAAAALLLALSACVTTPPAPPVAVTGQNATPCHGPYVADIDTSVPGEATPEAAAVAWSRSILAPSGAPIDGWKTTAEQTDRSGERTVRSGDWVVGVSRTIPGGWVVSGLGCRTSPS